MRLRICLVSPDRELSSFFGTLKDAAVPKDILERGYYSSRAFTVVASSYLPDTPPSISDFEEFLLDELADAARCIVLADTRWLHLINNVKAAVYVVPIDVSDLGKSALNFLRKITASALRSFGQIAWKFDDAADVKLLSLPLRNFYADELTELRRLCSDCPLDQDLNNLVEAQLARLRARVRPRRKSSFNTKYAVDDRSRFFSYGDERHSRPETGGTHQLSCVICSQFRFGCRIDDRRHYNVSERETDKTSIDGNFTNCHDDTAYERRDTHLNMFSNDMYY